MQFLARSYVSASCDVSILWLVLERRALTVRHSPPGSSRGVGRLRIAPTSNWRLDRRLHPGGEPAAWAAIFSGSNPQRSDAKLSGFQ